jgi:serine/threonine protein kinase
MLLLALRGEIYPGTCDPTDLDVARHLLADFGLDRVSFCGLHGVTLHAALNDMRCVTSPNRDPLSRLRGAAVLLGEAVEASARVSSGEIISQDGDQKALVRPLSPDVIDLVRRLYGIDGTTLPDSAACADEARATLLSEISWQDIVVHRVGTTSLLLKAPIANNPGDHRLIKLVHFHFQKLPLIGDATRCYYDVNRRIQQPHDAESLIAAVAASGEGWIIEDFIEGMTLAEFAQRERPGNVAPSPKRRLELLRGVYIPIVEALAHLHSDHVVHGDLNPSNIILNGTRPATESGDCDLTRISVWLIDLGRNLLASDAIGRVRSPDAQFVGQEVKSLPPEPSVLDPAADYYSLGLLLPICLGVASPQEIQGGRIPDELFAWAPLLARVMADAADPDPGCRLEMHGRRHAATIRFSHIRGIGRQVAGHWWRSTRLGSDSASAAKGESATRLEELRKHLRKVNNAMSEAGDPPTGERLAIDLLREVLQRIFRPRRGLGTLTKQMAEHEVPLADEYRYLANWVRLAALVLAGSVLITLVSVGARYGETQDIDVLHVSADQLRVVLAALGFTFDETLNARYNESCFVGLSFACANYLYYVCAFAGVDFRRCAPHNWLAPISECIMRGLTLFVLPCVVFANLATPEQWVWFSSVGVLLVALTTALVWMRAAEVIEYVEGAVLHRKGGPGYFAGLQPSKRLREWVPMLLCVATIYAVLAILLATKVGSDFMLYAILVTSVNVLGFGIMQTKRSVEEIAPNLIRTAVLGERLTMLAAASPESVVTTDDVGEKAWAEAQEREAGR